MQSFLERYIFFSCFLLFSSLQAAWMPPVDVSDPGGEASYPQIAVDPAGNATAVWTSSVGPDYIIQASTKPLGGSWQTKPDALSNTGTFSIFPHIAFDATGNATAVWFAAVGLNKSIQASFKPSGGSWQATPDTVASGLDIDAIEIQIAVDPAGNATAVWATSGVIQASTKPFRGHWQTTPDNISSTNAGRPQITVDLAGNTTAVWLELIGSNYFVQTSTKPFGGHWQATPDTLADTGPYSDYNFPQVAVNSAGDVTVVWQNSTGLNGIIQASTKPFGGTWQATPDKLSAPGQNAFYPVVAADGTTNETIAAWQRYDGTSNIIQASSKPFGGTWQNTPDNLSVSGQNSTAPQISMDAAGNATVVWPMGDSTYIIQASSKPSDGSWQGIPDTLSTLPTESFNPHVATDSFGDVTIAVWDGLEGSNAVIQAADKIYTPKVPTHFSGKLKKWRHGKLRWLLKTYWKPSQSRDITSYRIYKGSKLVDIISPDAKLQFTDHLKMRGSTKKYKISAVNSQNQESAKTKLKIKD